MLQRRFIGLILCAAVVGLFSSLESKVQAANPLVRIAARSASPFGQFYYTNTGATMTPAGNNYVRLDTINGTAYHSTFTTGLYDHGACAAALSAMHSYGYNVVRVFIDPGDPEHVARGQFGTGGSPDTNTAALYQPYIDNFIDFLRMANVNQIYVIPVLLYAPYNHYYNNLLDYGRPATIADTNTYYLFSGGVSAKTTYLSQFVSAVQSADSGNLASTIFAYEIENEIGCSTANPPFSMTSGNVTTQDGYTYDMSDPASRQNCQDHNTGVWANDCVNAVHSVDPNAMVSVSVFTFQAVGKAGSDGLEPINLPDPRFPARPFWLSQTSLSYVDIHQYPLGSSWSISSDLNSSEWYQIDHSAKPFLQGEYGASKGYYGDVVSAAYAMRDQRNNALSAGFAGGLFWTYDYDDNLFWTLLDNGGAINGVLAPGH